MPVFVPASVALKDSVVQSLLTEDADEALWQKQFADSIDPLIEMGQRAEDDYNAGRTWAIDKSAV